MTDVMPNETTPPPKPTARPRLPAEPFTVWRQVGFIVKNVVGWVLMLIALPVGIALPGPGGIPIFLLGFALATIPGKRRMTSHVMRGRPVEVNARTFVGIVSTLSVVACVAIIWYFDKRFDQVVDRLNVTGEARGRVVGLVVGLCVLATVVSYIAARVGTWGMNVFLRTLPKARRLVRPYLKRWGVALLPPRRKLVAHDGTHVNENEILEFSEQSRTNAKRIGAWLWSWARRALSLGLTLYIFFKIIKPIVEKWSETRERLGDITYVQLAVSVGMFALFLAAIRAMTWRSILFGFGFPVPRPAALRVWITSELSRYLPGAIWQVISRVRLIKPYGVRGSVCSTSQVLELAVFLLANVSVAVACLLFLGGKHIKDPMARQWLFISIGLVPLLSLILHPRVFYGLTDRILKRLGKPPIANRLSLGHLMRLFGLAIFGIVWQSFALWVLLHGPLQIGIRDWWILAGAYCLAWVAGFLAFWAPGGLGVREIVLIGALHVALPPAVRERFVAGDPTLQALAMLARLWTIAAELLVAAVAYPLDWGGVGRRPVPAPTVADVDAERATPVSD